MTVFSRAIIVRQVPNKSPAALSAVFHGLADPTRRAVLERLSRGAAAVSELARDSDMALPSFMQHLGVLEDSGLVRSHKTGRVRTYRLAPHGLRLAGNWLERQRTTWNRRLDQLDAYVTALRDNKS